MDEFDEAMRMNMTGLYPLIIVVALTACDGGSKSKEPETGAANDASFLQWRGDYDDGEEYGINDVVTIDGMAYIRIDDLPNPEAPSVSESWHQLSSVGERGQTGEQGPQGEAGPAGPTGPRGLQGEPGPQGAPGESSLRWQGDWRDDSVYVPGDAVGHAGRSYINVKETVAFESPDDDAFWSLLADRGADGAQGIQGPMGLTGTPGMDGQDGADGAQGATGPMGPAGMTGPQGPKGDTGATGPAGPQGPQGLQGPQGESGQAGPAGEPALVWRGNWNSGIAYAQGDAVAHGGRSYINIQDATGGESPENTAYWDLIADKGTDGAAGVQGVPGVDGQDGADGAQGATGPMGPAGMTGPQGPKGDTGSTGSAGPQGPQGLQGPQGESGQAGPAGEPALVWRGNWNSGIAYAQGDAVAHGGRSYINIQDATGGESPENTTYWDLIADKGADGAAGVQGVPGVDGQDGADGAQGATGPMGPAGMTGPQGAKGDTGEAGPAGPAGPAGVAGSQGPKGMAWQGTWQSGIAYSIDDVVEFEGSAWIAVMDTTGAELPSDGMYWDVLASGQQSTSDRYELAGFSSTQVDGGAGYIALLNACRLDYGSSARVAISEEILSTPDLQAQAGFAWVTHTQGEAYGGFTHDVYSGVSITTPLSCGFWSDSASSGKSGLAVDGATMSFQPLSCGSLASVACAIPSTVASQSYSFAGFSTAQFDGAAGYLSLKNACVADFGVDAKVSRSNEIMKASGLSALPGRAWVQKTMSPAAINYDKYSGIYFSRGNSCVGWTSNSSSYYGLYIDGATMSFGALKCDQVASVACSVPD